MENFKLKKCKCGCEFKQYNSLIWWCSYDCKSKYSKPTNLKLKPLYKLPNKNKPINKVSEKRKIENLKYSVLRIEFLSKPENRVCPVTGWETTEIHHKKGRVGDLFLDTNYWLAVSREGHIHMEENPEWAKEMGYSMDRLT